MILEVCRTPGKQHTNDGSEHKVGFYCAHGTDEVHDLMHNRSRGISNSDTVIGNGGRPESQLINSSMPQK